MFFKFASIVKKNNSKFKKFLINIDNKNEKFSKVARITKRINSIIKVIQISKNFDIETSNHFNKKNYVDKIDFFFQFVNLIQISRKNTTFIAIKKCCKTNSTNSSKKLNLKS